MLITRRFPAKAIILAAGHQHPIVIEAHRQPEHAGLAIDHRAGITDRDCFILPFFVNQAGFAPGSAPVRAPLEQRVDIAVVAASGLAAFAKGE